MEGTELLPRQRMASVPYAIQAGTATVMKMPYKARVYRNTSQSFPRDGLTKIQFNQKSYDPNNNFDNVTNFRYTVPVTIYYLIQAKVAFRHESQKLIFGNIQLLKNGNFLDVVTECDCDTGNTSFLQVVLSEIYQLNQGDFIESFEDIETTDGSSAYIGSPDSNSFSIHLMSQ